MMHRQSEFSVKSPLRGIISYRKGRGVGLVTIQDLSKIERYEYKYCIPPELVAPICNVVSRYCDPDSASVNGSYLISSLYFDSPSRLLYRQTIEKKAKRYKLRARRYSSGPVFCEVKNRSNAIVMKNRFAIDSADWPGVLLGASDADHEGEHVVNERLSPFLYRSLSINAEPSVVVRYARKAFVSRFDHYGRVTFDTQLEALKPRGYEIPIEDEEDWIPFDDPSQFALPVSGTVLELKCTTAVPLWMVELVRKFDLRSRGFSKYCCAADAIDDSNQLGDRASRIVIH